MTTNDVLAPQSARVQQEGEELYLSLDDAVAVWRNVSKKTANSALLQYNRARTTTLFVRKRLGISGPPSICFLYSQVEAVAEYLAAMKSPENSPHPSFAAAVQVIVTLWRSQSSRVVSSSSTFVTTSSPTPFTTIIQVQHSQTNIAQTVMTGLGMIVAEETKSLEETHSLHVRSRVRTADASFDHTTLEKHTLKRRIVYNGSDYTPLVTRVQDRLCEQQCNSLEAQRDSAIYYRNLPSDMLDFIDTSQQSIIQPSRQDYLAFLQQTWEIEAKHGFAAPPLPLVARQPLMLEWTPLEDEGPGDDLRGEEKEAEDAAVEADEDEYSAVSDEDEIHSAPDLESHERELVSVMRPRAHSI